MKSKQRSLSVIKMQEYILIFEIHPNKLNQCTFFIQRILSLSLHTSTYSRRTNHPRRLKSHSMLRRQFSDITWTIQHIWPVRWPLLRSLLRDHWRVFRREDCTDCIHHHLLYLMVSQFCNIFQARIGQFGIVPVVLRCQNYFFFSYFSIIPYWKLMRFTNERCLFLEKAEK